MQTVSSFSGAVHVLQQLSEEHGVIWILKWEFDVWRVLRICLCAEVCAVDVDTRYLDPVRAVGVAILQGFPVEVGGGQREDGPQAFQGRRCREDRVFSGLPDLACDKAAKDVRCVIDAFIRVNPSHGNLRFSGSGQCLAPGDFRPHALSLEVFEIQFPASFH